MNKRETHRQELEPLFNSLLADGNLAALSTYLVAQSGLPGRRANLELSYAFGDTVDSWAPE